MNTHDVFDQLIHNETTLRDAVRDSEAPVALIDVGNYRTLELSPVARERLGLRGVDIRDNDLVETSDDPEIARQFMRMINEGHLSRWVCHKSMQEPDGRVTDYVGTGRVVRVDGPRCLCLVFYVVAPRDDAAAFSNVDPFLVSDPLGLIRPVSKVDRVMELESQLRAIARQIEATGVIEIARSTPELSTTPGLEDLTPRQLDIVSRLVRGERVPTIASSMYLSQKTVRTHLANVFRKLGVHSQAELPDRIRGDE